MPEMTVFTMSKSPFKTLEPILYIMSNAPEKICTTPFHAVSQSPVNTPVKNVMMPVKISIIPDTMSAIIPAAVPTISPISPNVVVKENKSVPPTNSAKGSNIGIRLSRRGERLLTKSAPLS